MLIVTTERIPGYRVVEAKGEDFGLVVRSRGLGGNIARQRAYVPRGMCARYMSSADIR